ncbi:ABC transporter permease [Mycolicibacterium vaccae]|uniref:ABC transporter permease n=1 Tax=Mycolicibacterium vaccae TaxID=1810 RepID=UPI003CF18829
MVGRGLAYGWLAARRRAREMVLPASTTGTGAFLVVLVFGMSEGIRAQSASLGHTDQIGRAVVLIAVTVLLVGVAEVAVATTRTIAHRTRELGVLAANGVPRRPVVAALLVEPVIAAALGASGGVVTAALTVVVLARTELLATGMSWPGLALGGVVALAVSIAAALATSIVPTLRAASRPPIRSLNAGG